MTWTSPAPPPVSGRTTGPERPLLQGMLDYQRRELLSISAGLTAEQLAARPLPVTTLTLLGLIRHMAKVERGWLRKRVAGEDVEHLHDSEKRDDTDFNAIDPADAEHAVQQLQDEWTACDAAVAEVRLEHEIEVHGEPMSLRMVYLHLVQEYARHNGHADLIRQHVDGVTGR